MKEMGLAGQEAGGEVASSARCARLVAVAQRLADGFPDGDVQAVFLFGSAAWGDADEASDLDLMLLLDRPPGYREVTRARVADLLGLPGPLPEGPRFVDLDRVSAAGFAEGVKAGYWTQRVVNSVVLRDTGGAFAALRAEVCAAYGAPAAVQARVRALAARARGQRAAAGEALARGDAPLALLRARLGVQAAAGGLIERTGGRQSVTHFVEGVEQALAALGRPDLFAPFLGALALAGAASSAERSLRIYAEFGETLKDWLADPAIRAAHSDEALAWARFSYGEESREELRHKVDTYSRLGRHATLQYCLDGMFHLLIGINFGRALHARLLGSAERVPLPAFHTLLRREPVLFARWVEALRLDGGPAAFERAGGVLGEVLACAEGAP
jgi:hypothetical protein